MLPKNFFDNYSLKFGFENLYPALPDPAVGGKKIVAQGKSLSLSSVLFCG